MKRSEVITGETAGCDQGARAYSPKYQSRRDENKTYSIRKLLQKPLQCLEGYIARRGAESSLFARIYYGFFNASYGQEQMRVLAGHAAYRRTLVRPDGSLALLRRNVHRIEKGLLMRPRRIPFALDYIEETVKAYSKAMDSAGKDPLELQWAHDVLREYFTLIPEGNAMLRDQKLKFSSQEPPRRCMDTPLVPYCRDLSNSPPVQFDDLMELAVRRRSVRWFLQTKVSRDVVDKAISLALQAPSACNRQPIEIRIFDDPSLVQEVVRIPYGLAGYGHNVPCIAVIVGRQRNYFSEKDRHLIYIDGSLVVMSFLFALEAQGLSSCCINWPEIDKNNIRMAALLGLENDEVPVMLVAFGYPDPEGMVARSVKKPNQLVRFYNKK